MSQGLWKAGRPKARNRPGNHDNEGPRLARASPPERDVSMGEFLRSLAGSRTRRPRSGSTSARPYACSKFPLGEDKMFILRINYPCLPAPRGEGRKGEMVPERETAGPSSPVFRLHGREAHSRDPWSLMTALALK